MGVANDSTYGHDITRHARSGGGTYSVVRQTLLRAPLFPDPEADQGEHTLRTAIVVGDIGEAIRQGYRLNVPLREVVGVASDRTAPLVWSDRENVVIETVKLAEDRTGDVVIRLYEARGARSTATIRFGFPFATVRETDLFEREVDVIRADTRGTRSHDRRATVPARHPARDAGVARALPSTGSGSRSGSPTRRAAWPSDRADCPRDIR